MGAMVCPLQGRYGLPPAGPPPALPQAPRYGLPPAGPPPALPQAPRLGLRAEAPLFVPGQLWPPGSRRSDPEDSLTPAGSKTPPEV